MAIRPAGSAVIRNIRIGFRLLRPLEHAAGRRAAQGATCRETHSFRRMPHSVRPGFPAFFSGIGERMDTLTQKLTVLIAVLELLVALLRLIDLLK